MKRFILIFVLFFGVMTISSRPVQTYAYTEEEKQQAKAWLSAHGYAPTRAGAQQAYQDYKDGKLYIPGYSTESQDTDQTEEDSQTEEKATKKTTKKKKTIDASKEPVAAIKQSILDRADEWVKRAKDEETSTAKEKSKTSVEDMTDASEQESSDDAMKVRKKTSRLPVVVGIVLMTVFLAALVFRKRIKST